MQWLLVAALVFASFVALFALQNAQTVAIRFFAWERETSVAVIALGAAAIGAMSAVLAGLVRQLTTGLRLRQTRAELARVERKLTEVREENQKLEQVVVGAVEGEQRTERSPDAADSSIAQGNDGA